MQNTPLIGLELELFIVNKKGQRVPRAVDILNDKRNTGFLLKEMSNGMIEVIGKPGKTVTEVKKHFCESLHVLYQILDDLSLDVYPSTTLQGKKGFSHEEEAPRWKTARAVLGDLWDLGNHLAGTHVHLDKLADPVLQEKQYRLFLAMDPIFSLLSSTPFLFGKNGNKDYRVQVYRNEVFQAIPEVGMLQAYETVEEAKKRQAQAHKQWLALAQQKKHQSQGVASQNCHWGPLRITAKTFESRAADANLVSNICALAELYRAITQFVLDTNPNVCIDLTEETPIEHLFTYQAGTIILPSYPQLKAFEHLGITEGIQHEVLHNYIGNILRLGKQYSTELSSLERIWSTGETLSMEINSFAQQLGVGSYLNATQGNAVRRFLAQRFREDFQREHRCVHG